MATKDGQFLSGKRIVVVGGGIAGLSFVSALNRVWDNSLKPPEITVFEQQTREASLQPDPYVHTIRGGKHDDGLVALQKLGLLDAACAKGALNCGIIRVWSEEWKQLATIDPTPYGDVPDAALRISRQDLKTILLQAAETSKATWQWACACVGAERLANGKIRVTFDAKAENMLTTDCDLLIAADGANSRVRASFRPSDMQTTYAGSSQIGGISRLPKGLPQPVHEDYGLQMSSGKGVCCIYTPLDKTTIGWALSWMRPEQEAKTGPFTLDEFNSLKKQALDTGSMFGEPFKSIVEATDPASVFIRPAKEKPGFKHDPSLRGVVFLGDSNRVLNSFEQLGANLALGDGWDLAEQVCRSSSLEAAVLAYDKLSFPRAEHDMSFSYERIRFGHSTGALWKAYKYGMIAMRAVARK